MSAEAERDPSDDRDSHIDADPRPGLGRDPQKASADADGNGVCRPEDAEDDDWENPYSSRPPEYEGMSWREICAEADAREAEAKPEACAAGFLPRDVPAAARAAGPAGGFESGGPLDAAAPDLAVAGFAEEVTGPDGRCAGASDDALIGVLVAWQRQESRAAARKLAVAAELIRRRPAPGCEPVGPGGMPRGWGKFCLRREALLVEWR